MANQIQADPNRLRVTSGDLRDAGVALEGLGRQAAEVGVATDGVPMTGIALGDLSEYWSRGVGEVAQQVVLRASITESVALRFEFADSAFSLPPPEAPGERGQRLSAEGAGLSPGEAGVLDYLLGP